MNNKAALQKLNLEILINTNNFALKATNKKECCSSSSLFFLYEL